MRGDDTKETIRVWYFKRVHDRAYCALEAVARREICAVVGVSELSLEGAAEVRLVGAGTGPVLARLILQRERAEQAPCDHGRRPRADDPRAVCRAVPDWWWTSRHPRGCSFPVVHAQAAQRTILTIIEQFYAQVSPSLMSVGGGGGGGPPLSTLNCAGASPGWGDRSRGVTVPALRPSLPSARLHRAFSGIAPSSPPPFEVLHGGQAKRRGSACTRDGQGHGRMHGLSAACVWLNPDGNVIGGRGRRCSCWRR